ncbi:hypothetical protein [Nocardia brasiliensis]|uniref:hypothetical protein n=1 Tax=Nocardia brasiliensis TaxID=37326 RepID=UPI002455C2BA|nr:hypothetical protein [Nocardia brasiliensis]
MDWNYLTEKYHAELALVSRFCVEPAVVDCTGGGCWGIGGRLLDNGLHVLASNAEMEGHDGPGWTLGLYHVDEQLAYIATGSLHDQLTTAAGLTAAQLLALISHTSSQTALPADIVVL